MAIITEPIGTIPKSPQLAEETAVLAADRRGDGEWLRITLASIGDGVVTTDAEGRVTYCNGVAETMTGWPGGEAVGHPLAEVFHVIHEKSRLPVDNPALRALREGEPVGLANHAILIARGGRECSIEDQAAPMRDQAGATIGAVLVFRDVSERKRREAALRESEERHRFLSELTATTQPLTDPALVMSTAARLVAEQLHVDRCAYAEVEDESIYVITGDYSVSLPSIVGRWPVSGFGSECTRCMLAGEPYVVDDVDRDPRITADDLPAYRATNMGAVICVPLHKGHKLTAAMAVHQKSARRWTATDVQLVQTVVDRCWESLERMRMTRTLRESEARYRQAAAEAVRLAEANAKFRAFFEQGTNFGSVLTLDGTVVEANRRCVESCGFTREEIIGRPFWACGWWSRSESLQGIVREAALGAAAGQLFQAETHYFTADGSERSIDLILAPVSDDAGRVLFVAATGSDVTERRRMEDSLREADRQKDAFIALLAHELRNPLAPLRNGLQILRLAGSDAPAAERARSMMDRQLGHMVRLIDDLLDVARMNRNKMELRRSQVALTDVVNTALETARPLIDAEGHELTVSLPQRPIYLNADHTRLAQVFSNLLTNSAKYTERGGHIWLSAERRGDEVAVSVRDTGIGIPSESLGSIFDMFAQLDRPGGRAAGGLGIGLSLVKGLVQMHGGKVTVESGSQGKGSTFTVSLPVIVSQQEPAPEAPEITAQEGAGSMRRILVVDDNRDGADSLAMMLRLLKNDVQIAHDGVEAVEMAESFRPRIILMDLGMPRMNGYDATRRIRATSWGRNITIIALTGWGQEGDRVRSHEAGCNSHLVKPVHLPDLQKLLDEAVS